MKIFLLPDNLIDIFFEKLSYDDMINFTNVNHYTYERYKHKMKQMSFLFINEDYLSFRKNLIRYKYTKKEISDLGMIGVKGIQRVSPISNGYIYYDLRYLFELILLGLDIDDKNFLIECRKKSPVCKNQIEFILRKIKDCVSFSRRETIHKINFEPCLGVLHSLFEPNDKNWIYI